MLPPSSLTPANALTGSINPKTGQLTITFRNGFSACTSAGAGFDQFDFSITRQK